MVATSRSELVLLDDEIFTLGYAPTHVDFSMFEAWLLFWRALCQRWRLAAIARF
jgi:hypothetical protein